MSNPNTHRAYAMVDHCTLTDPRTGLDRVVHFEPKHKLIASGSEGYCAVKAVNYFKEHDGCETGVLECDKPGNPWEGEWAGIERIRS